VADEGKQRDFQTKPDNRPVEEKLLTIIFSGESRGVTDGDWNAALNRLMSTTGLDREGLIKKYAAADTKAGSGGDITEIIKLRVEAAVLRLEIENLKLQHKADLYRRDQRENLLMQGHQAEVDRISNERNQFKAQRDHFRVELDIMKAPCFPEIKCAAPGCAKMFRPRRRDHTACSNTCRKAISRARKKAEIQSPDVREA
jgi:hypothetical protein